MKLVRALFCMMLALFMTHCVSACAGIITGETPLAGISLLHRQVIEAQGEIINHEDLELLTEVMYHENYCNGEKCMLYTGSVVLNRTKDAMFPDTVKEVLYQNNPLQYSTTDLFYSTAIPKEVRILAIRLLLYGSVLPQNVVYQSMRPQGSGIYDKITSRYSSKDVEYFCYK